MTGHTENRMIRLAAYHFNTGARLGDVADQGIGCIDQEVTAEEFIVFDSGVVLHCVYVKVNSVVFWVLREWERIDRAQVEVLVPHDNMKFLVNKSHVTFRITDGKNTNRNNNWSHFINWERTILTIQTRSYSLFSVITLIDFSCNLNNLIAFLLQLFEAIDSQTTKFPVEVPVRALELLAPTWKTDSVRRPTDLLNVYDS